MIPSVREPVETSTIERHDTGHDVPRAVILQTRRYAAGTQIPTHVHARAQLVFAEEGVMRVSTVDGSWVVPSQRAVWVPPETPHTILIGSRPLLMRSLYIKQSVKSLGPRCCTVNVSELLRALILQFSRIPEVFDERGPDGRLAQVLLDQISSSQVTPLHLPMGRDARARKIMDFLAKHPEDTRTIEEWSSEVGGSPKTLTRLFLKETRMGFREWRQRARLLRALEYLAGGRSVHAVANDVGYESPSAFITMFTKTLGMTPAEYFRDTTEPRRRNILKSRHSGSKAKQVR
ncbi:MAG: helix-turn-helix transcriptional regulator [Burkholderiales bacterium]|nr:helix-turn-helix transcriptional regulator [Burkholderiales bacterium]